MTADFVLDVVVEMLRAEGYDAVQLREVARRAQVGLGTIYKLFSSREALIVSALSRWMATNAYAPFEAYGPDESLRDLIIRELRQVFEPWQREPRMLHAYYRARFGPAGEHLNRQGSDVFVPVIESVLDNYDPDYTQALALTLTNVCYGVLSRVAHGELDAAEMLPTIESAVALVTDNEKARATSHRRQPRNTGRS